jgi:hypothetical protein
MPLTLRPTGLSGDPNRNDWSVYEDGAEIGRLYEDRHLEQLLCSSCLVWAAQRKHCAAKSRYCLGDISAERMRHLLTLASPGRAPRASVAVTAAPRIACVGMIGPAPAPRARLAP